MAEIVKTWTGLFLGCLIALTSLLTSNSVLAQSEEKTFTAPEVGFSMKYPSDWGYAITNHSGTLYGVDLCPSLYMEKEDNLSCSIYSPVTLQLNVYKLKEGTTLRQFYDDRISWFELFKDINGPSKYLNTSKLNISGFSAIQTISTRSSSGAAIGKFLQSVGKEPNTIKDLGLYLVNGHNGYTIVGQTDEESDFDTYYPTIQKMINSIQIQGAKGSPENTAFLPAIKNTPTDDVILLSQKLKKGSGDYNDNLYI